MPNAIVTGATGILGRAIVHELASDSQTWSKIYALSRSKKEAYPSNVVHSHIDLTGDAKAMASELSSITSVEYVFFAAYLQSGDEQQLCDDNGSMLKNFLDALQSTGLSKSLKRVILVTGAKQYGVHLGRVKTPMEESDPWLTQDKGPFPPNFYYVQQDILRQAAQSSQGKWDWTVTYPNDVIGLAKGNFMNLATSVGLYAAVSKELGQAELPFPGSALFYSMFDDFTDAKLHAQFCAWAASSPAASNQAFNMVNGQPTSWQVMWPKLAKYFGMRVPPKQLAGEAKEGSEMKLADKPPIAFQVAEMGLEGVNADTQSKVVQRIDLVKWSQRSDVQEAWKRLAQREGLEEDAFNKATWGFLGFVLGREYELIISMAKARKAGWTGFKDTWDALRDVFDELKQEKVLPK